MKQKQKSRQICANKKALHDYFVLDRYEAGIVLAGSEVKSLRKGACNLRDSYCYISKGEVFVRGMHIASYDLGGAFSPKDSKRDRKLLLNRAEIAKIGGKIKEKGYTLIPLSLYFKESLVKVEIAVCQGKHTYDKRRTIAEKDQRREMERDIKEYTAKRGER